MTPPLPSLTMRVTVFLIFFCTPSLSDIVISHVQVEDARSCAGIFAGLPEQKISGITMEDCSVSMRQDAAPEIPAMMAGIDPMSAAGFVFKNTEQVTMKQVELEHVIGEKIIRL